ncbi:LPS export ABC transporter periplasmic protein LptC [bacterium]|nr:LPS export ABC transporter periplasmic protein LptC [bacterium]MBU1653072.1 LPS export ABC transporter periplasmic protein LptC [bacterium]
MFIALTVMIALSGCAKIDDPSADNDEADKHPDQEIWGGKIEVTDNGVLKSVVQAGYMQYFEQERLTLLDSGVVVDFYNSKGEHSSVLTSRQAKIDERIDIFVALGNVVVTSDSGEILKTERLYWDKELKRIKSDTLAILLTELDSLRGYDFESDENLTDWILKNPTGQTMRRQE